MGGRPSYQKCVDDSDYCNCINKEGKIQYCPEPQPFLANSLNNNRSVRLTIIVYLITKFIL